MNNDKVVELVENHTPRIILKLLKEVQGTYLAGGAIRSLFDNHPAQDYDIYFEDDKAVLKAIDFLRKNDFELHSVSGCAKTYIKSGIIVQLCDEHKYKDAQAVIDSFDINACRMIYWVTVQNLPLAFKTKAKVQGHALVSDTAINDAKFKKITFNNTKHLLSLLDRIQKFKVRGYTCSQAQYFKLFRELAVLSDEELIKRLSYAAYKSPKENIVAVPDPDDIMAVTVPQGVKKVRVSVSGSGGVGGGNNLL